MRGQEKIIEARIAGHVPPFVFMNDYPCQTDWFEFGEHATVCTHGDSIGSMDMRFLVGLKVSITATTEQRAKALFEIAKKSGANLVAASVAQQEKHHSEQTGWVQIWQKAVQ